MADINAGIMSAIDDYLNLSVSPRFALLVVGEWGSGKTHLVRRILEEQNGSARKVLSVSLYGLNRTSQIDKIIFQQLHPILGSEKLRFAGRVLANVLSATIPISLPFETTAEVDLALPAIDMEKLAAKPEDQVIVFDDLERTGMEIGAALGYINALSEISGLKVIVCVNQTELLNGKDGEAYTKQREKVFGKILQVQPDLANALAIFAREVMPPLYAEYLRRNLSVIHAVFDESGHQNLRALRQALLWFQGIYICLPDSARKSDEYLNEFFSLYLLIALENADALVDSNFLSDISGAGDMKKFFLDRAGKEEVSRGQTVREKSSWLRNSALAGQSVQFWSSFFLQGVMNCDALKELVEAHPKFLEQNTANWIRLWWWQQLNQSELDALFPLVMKDLEQGVLTNVFEVVHATGSILDLVDRGLISGCTPESWIKRSQKFFEHLRTESAFSRTGDTVSPYELDFLFGYAGLGFADHVPGFDRLKAHARNAFGEYVEQRNSAVVARLMSYLEQGELHKFSEELGALNNSYRYFPVLGHLNAAEFLRAALTLSTVGMWRELAGTLDAYLKSRREATQMEIKFLKSMSRLLAKESAVRRGTLVAEGIKILLKVVKEHVPVGAPAEHKSDKG